MIARRLLIPEACDVLSRHNNRMAIGALAAALSAPVGELRRQVTAFGNADESSTIHEPGFDQFLFIERPGSDDEDSYADDGADDDPGDSDEDVVVLAGDLEDFLGTERFDAQVLGPLYTAAEDLLAQEPDNEALASAATKLREQFLPGIKPRRHYGQATIAATAEAIRLNRKMRIIYSRAWQPGVTERVIEPYRLVNTRRGYEIDAGPIDEAGNLRTFIISRIHDYEVLESEFDRPPNAAELSDAMRETVAVTGFVPQASRWAINKYAERVKWLDDSGDDDVVFVAHVLPPVSERVALMALVAGPGLALDDEQYEVARGQLARRLWDQHRLTEY